MFVVVSHIAVHVFAFRCFFKFRFDGHSCCISCDSTISNGPERHLRRFVFDDVSVVCLMGRIIFAWVDPRLPEVISVHLHPGVAVILFLSSTSLYSAVFTYLFFSNHWNNQDLAHKACSRLSDFLYFFWTLPYFIFLTPFLSILHASADFPSCLCVGMSRAGSAPACSHFMLIGPAVPLKFTMATTTCRLATLLLSLIPASALHRQRERERQKRWKISQIIFFCMCVFVCYTWVCVAPQLWLRRKCVEWDNKIVRCSLFVHVACMDRHSL